MVLKFQNRKERKGKGKGKKKKQGEKQKLYMIVARNRFIIMSKMNLNVLHQIKCYSMK